MTKFISTTGNNSEPCNNVRCFDHPAPDLKSVADTITHENWCPALFYDKYRKLANFKAVYYIGLDVDEFVNIEWVKGLIARYGYRYLIQPSRNHMKEKRTNGGKVKPACPRFRVVFELSEPILSLESFVATMQDLILKFPFVDLGAIDGARFFFKGGPIDTLSLEGSPVQVVHGMGRLSGEALRFIQTGKFLNNWNATLYKVAKDFQQQGYDEATFKEVLDRWTCQLPDIGEGALSINDEITIDRAFDDLPLHEPRTVGRPTDPNKPPHMSLEEALDIAAETISPQFLQVVSDESTAYYRIEDIDRKVVKHIRNEEKMDRDISAALRAKKQISNKVKIVKAWKTHGPALDEHPSAYEWEESDKWALHKMKLDLRPGPYPAWQEFLNRLSSPDDFMAMSYSIYEPLHVGRQICWLYGPNGQDGKSVIIKALTEPLGKLGVRAISNTALKGNSNFLLFSLYGARAIIYPDCKDRNFILRESSRNMSSGDLQIIEQKGKDAISVYFYARLMVASNYPPNITSGGADRSRTLLIQVEESLNKSDPTFIDRLRDEWSHYMWASREKYRKKCPTHDHIELDPISLELVDQSHALFEEAIAVKVDTLFEFGSEYVCSSIEFQSAISGVTGSIYKVEDIRHYLLTTRGLKVKSLHGSNTYYGIRTRRSIIENSISNKVIK